MLQKKTHVMVKSANVMKKNYTIISIKVYKSNKETIKYKQHH